jgi:hypothetical protein
MMDEVEEQEMIELRRSRRKAARRLMGGNTAARRNQAFNQFDSDGDPLPAKGQPVQRYLYCVRDNDEPWFYFTDDPVDAGLHEMTGDDGEGYVDFIIDLDTGEHVRVEPAHAFYVHRESDGPYKFPQPEAGFVRVFFYADVSPNDLDTVKKPIILVNDDITHPFAATRLEGEQRNTEDIDIGHPYADN